MQRHEFPSRDIAKLVMLFLADWISAVDSFTGKDWVAVIPRGSATLLPGFAARNSFLQRVSTIASHAVSQGMHIVTPSCQQPEAYV